MLKKVTDRLVVAGCVAATDEAAQILAVATDDAALELMIGRRERGEPLAWITGGSTFGGRPIQVGPGVYVPRVQSEELARRAALLLPSTGRAVDLCTGAGAIAAHLAAEVPGATVVGVERDRRAASCARAYGVRVVVADIARPLPIAPNRRVDIVTAVAPYVPTGDLDLLPADVLRHEPLLALHGGTDGLDLVRAVVARAAVILRGGGWLLTELGGVQDELIAGDLDGRGFDVVEPWWDPEGDLRGIAARRADDA